MLQRKGKYIIYSYSHSYIAKGKRFPCVYFSILNIILHTRLRQGSEHISSFVQLRASVPAHWSQTMTAQPPIYFEQNDPYSRTSGNDRFMKTYLIISFLILMNFVRNEKYLIIDRSAFQLPNEKIWISNRGTEFDEKDRRERKERSKTRRCIE